MYVGLSLFHIWISYDLSLLLVRTINIHPAIVFLLYYLPNSHTVFIFVWNIFFNFVLPCFSLFWARIAGHLYDNNIIWLKLKSLNSGSLRLLMIDVISYKAQLSSKVRKACYSLVEVMLFLPQLFFVNYPCHKTVTFEELLLHAFHFR